MLKEVVTAVHQSSSFRISFVFGWWIRGKPSPYWKDGTSTTLTRPDALDLRLPGLACSECSKFPAH